MFHIWPYIWVQVILGVTYLSGHFGVLLGVLCTDDQSRATKQEQANLCAVTVLCAST